MSSSSLILSSYITVILPVFGADFGFLELVERFSLTAKCGQWFKNSRSGEMSFLFVPTVLVGHGAFLFKTYFEELNVACVEQNVAGLFRIFLVWVDHV